MFYWLVWENICIDLQMMLREVHTCSTCLWAELLKSLWKMSAPQALHGVNNYEEVSCSML